MNLKIQMDVFIEEQYKTYNRMKKLQQNFEKNPSSNNGERLVRIELLSSYYKTFCETHEGIDRILSKHNVEPTNSDYFKEDLAFKCELLYLKMKGQLLDDQPTEVEASNSEESSFPIEDKSAAMETPSAENISLDVPKFSGEIADWQDFRSEYYSLVHTNSEINNFQKFTYLKAALPDEIFEMIKHFPISEDRPTNYEDAWKFLEEKFSKRAHIEGYLVKLLEQPPVSEGSSDSFSQLLDTTKNCLNGLNSLNVNTNNWDVFLIHLLVQKLNEKSKIEWNQTHSPHKSPKLHLFFNFLKLKAQPDSKLEEMKKESVSVVDENSKLKSRRSSKLEQIKKENASVDLNPRIKKIFGCAYCEQKHNLYQCEKFELLGIDDRKAFVNNKDICLRCLTSYHTIADCSKPYKCYICKSPDHHYMLHKNLKGSQSCEQLD